MWVCGGAGGWRPELPFLAEARAARCRSGREVPTRREGARGPRRWPGGHGTSTRRLWASGGLDISAGLDYPPPGGLGHKNRRDARELHVEVEHKLAASDLDRAFVALQRVGAILLFMKCKPQMDYTHRRAWSARATQVRRHKGGSMATTFIPRLSTITASGMPHRSGSGESLAIVQASTCSTRGRKPRTEWTLGQRR